MIGHYSVEACSDYYSHDLGLLLVRRVVYLCVDVRFDPPHTFKDPSH